VRACCECLRCTVYFLKKTKFQLFRDFIPAIKSCYSCVEVVVSSFRIQLLTCSVRSPSQCSLRCVRLVTPHSGKAIRTGVRHPNGTTSWSTPLAFFHLHWGALRPTARSRISAQTPFPVHIPGYAIRRCGVGPAHPRAIPNYPVGTGEVGGGGKGAAGRMDGAADDLCHSKAARGGAEQGAEEEGWGGARGGGEEQPAAGRTGRRREAEQEAPHRIRTSMARS
jgi:hypothetical protein